MLEIQTERILKMKKRIAILMAAMLVVSCAAGCGQKTNNGASKADTNTAKTDVSDNYGTGDYSADQVDMGSIDGEELKSETDKRDYSGKLGDAEVTINDAKVIEYNDEKVVVISFDFKNNSDTPTPFTGVFKADAYQDDSHLAPVVVTGIEGVTMMALTENVEKGDTITVQKAYRLADDSTPVVIEVTEANYSGGEIQGYTKTFEF